MQRMKREVSPILGVVAILIALTAVQVLYWRGLVGAPEDVGDWHMSERLRESLSAPTGLAEVSVTTLAGQPQPGRQDGRGTQARFDGPAAVALSASGLAYVADSRNHCIRATAADGSVSTLAGTGTPGYADGPARAALFSAPAGIAVAPDGSVLVADTGNHRLRRIRPGIVSTAAGSPTPRDDLGRELGGYRDGPAAQAQFCYPVGLAVGGDGAVYVADAGNHRVRCLSPAGYVTTLPTEPEAALKTPTALTLAPDGQLWVADTAGDRLWVGPRQGPLRPWEPAEEFGLAKPSGLAVLAGTNPAPGPYLCDAENHCLWQVDSDQLLLLAGAQDPNSPGWNDGPGSEAQFSCPAGLAAGADGCLYVADFGNNCLRRVSFAQRWEGGPRAEPRHRGNRETQLDRADRRGAAHSQRFER